MKVLVCLLTLLLTSMYGDGQIDQDEFPVPEGPFFGQRPPGNNSVVIASDQIPSGGRVEFGLSISPDGRYSDLASTRGSVRHQIFMGSRPG